MRLKTEGDGRIFPKTDSSETIIDCLLREARRLEIKLCLRCGVEHADRGAAGGFDLRLSNGETIFADRLLLAIGGCRIPAAARLAMDAHLIGVEAILAGGDAAEKELIRRERQPA